MVDNTGKVPRDRYVESPGQRRPELTFLGYRQPWDFQAGAGTPSPQIHHTYFRRTPFQSWRERRSAVWVPYLLIYSSLRNRWITVSCSPQVGGCSPNVKFTMPRRVLTSKFLSSLTITVDIYWVLPCARQCSQSSAGLLILTIILWDEYYSYLHVTNEGTGQRFGNLFKATELGFNRQAVVLAKYFSNINYITTGPQPNSFSNDLRNGVLEEKATF